MQNLLPCKTPTRGPHMSGALSALSSGHSVTYEDPDAHLGHHRPLVMRHHHNAEMLHGKSIHYPSGYPMTRSPPFLVSNSPGPDPYRSNDNVYEELGPGRDSDGESEPPMHSDDDFAEDELSLPGERSFNKPTDTNNSASTVMAAYPDRTEAHTASNNNGPERHSVLSSSSSTQDASTATAVSSSSSHNNNTNSHHGNACTATASARNGAGAILTNMLRHTTGRKSSANVARSNNERRIPQADDLNATVSSVETANLRSVQQIYDNSSNLMALGYQQHQQPHHALNYPQSQSYHSSLHHMHHHSNNRNASIHPVPHFYNTIESEVERRNRINAQLKNSMSPAVATIFRERIQYPGSARYPQHFYNGNSASGLLPAIARARTNPRSMDRRRGRVAAPSDPIEPAYGYAEPVYHHNYHYESCNTPNVLQPRVPQPVSTCPTYTLPEYNSGSISSSYRQHYHPLQPAPQSCQNSTSLYGHGDSSFGSDSGYSHHTPASSIGRHDYDIALPIPPAPPAPTQKPPSKLANALNFSWGRNRKKPASRDSNCISMRPNTNKPPALSTSSTAEESSPNNNSASSTITSTLENTSSSSSGGGTLPTQNNNELLQA